MPWEPWGDCGSITGSAVQEPGPSEILTGQQGDHCGHQCPSEAKEHTPVRQQCTPFLPGPAQLLHEELYFGVCLDGKKSLAKSLVRILEKLEKEQVTKGALVSPMTYLTNPGKSLDSALSAPFLGGFGG